MKKSIVVLMVVFVSLAVAQSQQPATGAPAASGQQAAPQGQPAQQKTIKDPAEYNAYVSAMKTTDPNQKAIQLEGFLQQYPNSVMKEDALELLMGAYQQANNLPKVTEAAKRLLQAAPTNLKALALLTFLDRANANAGGPQAQQLLAEAAQYGQQGLTALQTAQKPEGVSDADWGKLKTQTSMIFNGAIGQNALATKDYPTAQKALQAAIDAAPDDQANLATNAYALGTAYLQSEPINPLGFWYIAKAASLFAAAPPQQQALLKYGRSRYMRFHGGEDGWNELVQQAAAQPTPPAGFAVKPAPTPAEQAGILVQQKPVTQMSFDEIQLILTSGNEQAAEKVWGELKDKATTFQAKVISATATKLMLAATYEGGEKNVADVDLTMTAAIPAKFIPKPGADATVKGIPVSYTPNPFMIVMKEGVLGGNAAAAAEPATKKPAAKSGSKPAARKPGTKR